MSTNKSQKQLVQQFIGITQASEAQATKWLRNAGWTVDAAVDAFYDSGEAPEGEKTTSADETFGKYANKETPPTIDVDGMETLCKDMGLDMYESPEVLLLCHKADAAKQGVLTAAEWRRLFGSTRAQSIQDLKAKLSGLRAETGREPFWTWVYKFSCAEGQRSVEKDVVIALLRMLVPTWGLLESYLSYLGQEKTKTATKDTWSMLLQFMGKFTSRADLTTKWSTSDADMWPSQLDEYRDWALKQK